MIEESLQQTTPISLFFEALHLTTPKTYQVTSLVGPDHQVGNHWCIKTTAFCNLIIITLYIYIAPLKTDTLDPFDNLWIKLDLVSNWNEVL